MPDREKVIKEFNHLLNAAKGNYQDFVDLTVDMGEDILALLKEHEKKQIKLHKKHVITWKRDDEFTIRKLYEEICETLIDEGELFIARTDDHEKVDFVFYVAEEVKFDA